MQQQQQLGISYNAAWHMWHKLMHVMHETNSKRSLSGPVQIDDAHLGGEARFGKRGRGAGGKTPFVAVVQANKEGHPQKVKLNVVKCFRKGETRRWAQQHLLPDCEVVSDGLRCFRAIGDAGISHAVPSRSRSLSSTGSTPCWII